MTLQRKVEKIIIDLKDIRNECRYSDEKERLHGAITILEGLYITSDNER